MAERYFEPADVDTLIPTLARVMAAVMRANEEAGAIAGRLEAERERIGLAGGGMIDRGMTDRQIFDELLQEASPLLLQPHLKP